MEFVSLTLPDEPALWPLWLEERLVGDDLRQFVIEHAAITGLAPATAPALADLLGAARQPVLANGLGELSANQLRTFFEHPRLLFELQEDVLANGGSYWDGVRRPASIDRALDPGVARWNDRPAREQTATETQPANSVAHAGNSSRAGAGRTHPRRRQLAVLGTLAAVVTLAVTTWLFRPATSPWAFEDPERFTAATASPQQYLELLAQAAHDFRPARSTTPDQLRNETRRFRDSCEKLATATHAPLKSEDAAWLTESCRKWMVRLDEQVAVLNDGSVPFEEVRGKLQTVVDDLVGKLKSRAVQSAA